MGSRHWLVATLIGAAVAPQAASQPGPDTIILRSGAVHRGDLASCGTEACSMSGNRIGRASISWIGLRVQPPPPAVRNATRTEIHLENKTVVTASNVTVDATHVNADGKRYPRAQVAWIHFPAPAPVSKGAWKGRMEYSLSGETMTFTGFWDVTVATDAGGKLKGALTGEETYVDAKPRCASTVLRKLKYDAVLIGQVHREHGGLALDIESENSEPGEYHLAPPCPYKPFPWGGPNPYVLYEPAVRQMIGNLKPAADGSLQSSTEWRMPANTKYLGKAKITLRPANK